HSSGSPCLRKRITGSGLRQSSQLAPRNTSSLLKKSCARHRNKVGLQREKALTPALSRYAGEGEEGHGKGTEPLVSYQPYSPFALFAFSPFSFRPPFTR